MSTTRHMSDNTTDLVAHVAGSAVIDRSMAVLAAEGLAGWVICDGSCGGLAGCSVAPIERRPAVAA